MKKRWESYVMYRQNEKRVEFCKNVNPVPTGSLQVTKNGPN